MGLLADRILDAGFPLAVYNRTRERTEPLAARGADVLDSPAEALQRADVCITMLADDAALEQVAGEILEGARAGTTLIDMSTVSVSASERVAAKAEDAGVHYVRSPVSGNPGVVVSGNLTLIVSGPEDVVAQVRPLLERSDRSCSTSARASGRGWRSSCCRSSSAAPRSCSARRSSSARRAASSGSGWST